MATKRAAKKTKKPASSVAKKDPKAKARTGSPPVGSIGEDAIERLITQWISRPKQAADYARLPHDRLMEEANNILEQRDDLDAFAQACTPIKDSAFDYIAVILGMLMRQPGGAASTKPKALAKSAAVTSATKEVLHSLSLVLARAEACGRPLRLFELSRAPWAAEGFITQLFHVVQAGRRRVEKWDDPVHAMGMFAQLERATLALERAWKLPATGSPNDDDALRTMALQRLLYDAITYLAAYGRAVFPPKDKRHQAYLLLELFPLRPPVGLKSPLQLLGA